MNSDDHNQDHLDAQRWRSLMSCARLRPLGSAGLEGDRDYYDKPYNGYAHLGLELWTKYDARDAETEARLKGEKDTARAWLTKFTDIALTLQAASPPEIGDSDSASGIDLFEQTFPPGDQAWFDPVKKRYWPRTQSPEDQGAATLQNARWEAWRARPAAQPPVPEMSHWSSENPGRADQFRAEARACRKALGFDPDADDIAPRDLAEAIRALAHQASDNPYRVPAVTQALIDEVSRYGGKCRDCADENGICPASHLPCENSDKAVRFVLESLHYKITHGFITPASLKDNLS